MEKESKKVYEVGEKKKAWIPHPLPPSEDKHSYLFFGLHPSRKSLHIYERFKTPTYTNGFLLYMLFCQCVLDMFPYLQIQIDFIC